MRIFFGSGKRSPSKCDLPYQLGATYSNHVQCLCLEGMVVLVIFLHYQLPLIDFNELDYLFCKDIASILL